METDDRLLLVLNEVRKMNRLQIENRKSIDQMSDKITYYQDLFDSMDAKNNRNTNQSVVREIRANLLRLSILANPEMAAMYRSGKMKSYIIESSDNYGLGKWLQITKNPEEIFSNSKLQLESFYLTSTGFQSIESNSYLMVELANPLGSNKSLHLSTISGGGLLSTAIEIILDGSVKSEGTPILVSNFNTALEKTGIALARFSIEGVDSTLGGNVIWSIIQANRMTVMDLDGRLIIAPGHCLIIRMMNRARETNSVSINLAWWE
ncbi:MAG: hypothetical protein ACYCVD_16785 [Desulfitobacteriaceae bacterium]